VLEGRAHISSGGSGSSTRRPSRPTAGFPTAPGKKPFHLGQRWPHAVVGRWAGVALLGGQTDGRPDVRSTAQLVYA
jgi:hypothetical protein